MGTFKATIKTPLLSKADSNSTLLGDVAKGTKFVGELRGNFIKTRIAAISPTEGFVKFLGASVEVVPLPSLAEEEFGAFCDMVTRVARDSKANRDYLMAVAYCGTNNLTDFGPEDSTKAGPFQLDEVQWKAAIAPGGPAENLGYREEDRLDWTRQPRVAALLAADCANKFATVLKRPPTFSELYFSQRIGPAAFNALAKPPTTLCKDAFVEAAAPGSYAAELKGGNKSIAEALADLRAKLIAALAKALELIDRQPPEVRFAHPEDQDPAWLTVARAELSLGVSETTDRKNSPRIKEYLQKTQTDDASDTTPWCGAFATFCLKVSGVPNIADSVQTPASAATDWWKDHWGEEAMGDDAHRIGTVVVLKPDNSPGHMGFLVEGSTADTIHLLAGNQGGGGTGPGRVSIVPFPASNVIARRWLSAPVPESDVKTSNVQPTGDDAKFVLKAPGIMRRLMDDFPGLAIHHAAAVLGNIGHECRGFLDLHQIGMPPGEGGHGWCQWDGSRRTTFLDWASSKGGWESDEANYTFLVFELKGTEKAAFASTRQQENLERAVEVFDRKFERSGKPAWPSRKRYARLALQAFNVS